MNKSPQSWEAAILLFAIAVTATTMLAYSLMIIYTWTIPWYVWVILVAICAVPTLGQRLIRRQR